MCGSSVVSAASPACPRLSECEADGGMGGISVWAGSGLDVRDDRAYGGAYGTQEGLFLAAGEIASAGKTTAAQVAAKLLCRRGRCAVAVTRRKPGIANDV